MSEPKKILFVVDTLAQHGAERYLYEILKSIDQSKFDCKVLSTYPLNDLNNYYLPLIEELGIEVDTFTLGELYPHIASSFVRKLRNSLTYRWLNLTGQKEELKKRAEAELHKKLQGYELLSILKIEVFNRFPNIFSTYSNSVIHLLSWGIQYQENPYRLLPNKPYRFVTMIESQKEHVLEADFENIKNPQFDFFQFPLILDLKERKNEYQVRSGAPIIGVFSRIHYDQPTIMFLFAFQLLLKRIPDAKFFFYGKAVTEQFQKFYEQTAEILGISHAMEFKGHVNDLKTSIQNDGITMGWMNIGNSTLGYSSIEISSYGLPVTFFNIEPHDSKLIDERLNVFNDVERFVEHSVEVIQDSTRLQQESDKMYDFIQSTHDAKNIKGLEAYFEASMKN